MKQIIILLLNLFVFISQQFATEKNTIFTSKLNVATFNIRLQTSADTAARSWDNRKNSVARIIKQYDFDVFGVQEVGNSQQEADLTTLLPAYSYFGKGRDNQEGSKGEQIGIFYKTKRFSIKENGFFFLSETPETISIGWDAAYRRICVWAKMYDKNTKITFFVFCTHFDHIGIKAREESARLIVKKIQSIAKEYPVLLVGDLNASTESSDMYTTLSSYLEDSREKTIIKPTGFEGTFNGYDITSTTFDKKVRIDYIFCRKVTVMEYKI
ncbi:MAG: endonuclease/exonuclease/phosphatase family protein, partial [Paludibacter sp.]